MTIRGLTIDLWNTILENKHYTEERIEILHQLCQKNGLSRSKADILKHYYDFVLPALRADRTKTMRHITNKERLQRILASLDLHFDTGSVQELIQQFEHLMLQDPPALKEGVYDTLHTIKKRWDIPMVLISDTGITPGRILSQVLDRHGVLSLFRKTIYSDEIGMNKPARLPFDLAVEALQCQPEEIMHIGDLPHTDILGANEIGMVSVWFKDPNYQSPETVQSDYKIDRFADLIPLIEKLAA